MAHRNRTTEHNTGTKSWLDNLGDNATKKFIGTVGALTFALTGCTSPAGAENTPPAPAATSTNIGETPRPSEAESTVESTSPSAIETDTTKAPESSESVASPTLSPAEPEVTTSPSDIIDTEPIRDWQLPEDMEQVMAQWDTMDQLARATYAYQFIDLNGGGYTPEGAEWTPTDSALRAVHGLNVISDYINDESNPNNKDVALKLLDGMIGDDPDYDTRISLPGYFSATADTLGSKNCPTAECVAYRRNAFLPEPNSILKASPDFTLTKDTNGLAHMTSVTTLQLKDNTEGADEMFPDGIKGKEQLVVTIMLNTMTGNSRPLIDMLLFGTSHNVVYVNGQPSVPVSSLPGVINFTKS